MFDEWLKKNLKELKIDVSVYHSYIVGILEDSIDEEEKRETITDIVSSLIVRILKLYFIFLIIDLNFFTGI